MKKQIKKTILNERTSMSYFNMYCLENHIDKNGYAVAGQMLKGFLKAYPNLINDLNGVSQSFQELIDDPSGEYYIDDYEVTVLTNTYQDIANDEPVSKYVWNRIPAEQYINAVGRNSAVNSRMAGNPMRAEFAGRLTHQVGLRRLQDMLDTICSNFTVMQANNLVLKLDFQVHMRLLDDRIIEILEKNGLEPGSLMRSGEFTEDMTVQDPDFPLSENQLLFLRASNVKYVVQSLYAKWAAFAMFKQEKLKTYYYDNVIYADSYDVDPKNEIFNYVCASDVEMDTIRKILEDCPYDADENQILITINRCVNVVHMRGDLSLAFVEGGRTTCDRASNQKPEDIKENRKMKNIPTRKQLLEAIKYWGRMLREDVSQDENGMYDMNDAYFSAFVDTADRIGLDADFALQYYEDVKAQSRIDKIRFSPEDLAYNAKTEYAQTHSKKLSLADLDSIRNAAAKKPAPAQKPKQIYDFSGNFDQICAKYGEDKLHDLFDNLMFMSYKTEEGKYGTLYRLLATFDLNGNELDKQVELFFHNGKDKLSFCTGMWEREVGSHVKSLESRAAPMPKSEIKMRGADGKIRAKYNDHRQVSQVGRDGKQWGTFDENDMF